jgi:hypothetical protein
VKRSLTMLCIAGAIGSATVVPGCDRASREQAAVVQEKSASGLTARVSLDRAAISTAERAVLTIDTTTPAGWEPQVVDLAGFLPEGLTLVEARPETRRGGGAAALTLRREYVIEPFLDGKFEIKPIEIVASKRVAAGVPSDAPPEAVSVTTDPIALEVASVLKQGETDLAATKGVVDPREPTPWLLIGLGGAALLMGAGVTAWLLMRKREVVAPPPVLVPAHELALRRLDGLMAKRLVESGRFEPFYAEASWILRTYIEDRFGLHAPDRTTEEFLQESRTSAVLVDEDVRVLERFMGHVDLVKFAAVTPSEREAQSVAGTVREFIERTRAADKLVEEVVQQEVAAAAGEVAA